MPGTDVLKVGQFSAFYGDRADGISQLIDSDVDVLVGDYLAELTMLILRKNQLRGRVGYASTFLEQISPELSRIADNRIKVVTNAGGLDPLGCAQDLRAIIAEQGLDLSVVAIDGDNLVGRLEGLRAEGELFRNLDTHDELQASADVLTANAYLGAWPIVEALRRGADVVICPRVTDASVVIGPAAWHFGWAADDWDRLAGALVAGHVIECGAQATGGQYSRFDDHAELGLPGMPIALIESDGSSVITKATGSGGVVDIGTVTAQLVYEIGTPLYDNPDVTADFTSIDIQLHAENQVRLSKTKGYAPPASLKVSLAFEGGYRNTAIVGLTGGRIKEKAAWLRQGVERAVGAAETFDGFRWSVIGPHRDGDGSIEDVTAFVIISVKDHDRRKVDRRAFSIPITQLAVSSIPGYFLLTPPATEKMYGTYWPTTVTRAHVTPEVVTQDGHRHSVHWTSPTRTEPVVLPVAQVSPTAAAGGFEDRVQAPLRLVVGTRSGDKGGKANLGVWARDARGYAWLAQALTVDEFKRLVPETAELRVDRYELPNLNALNFVAHAFLDDGVASCLRVDAQAKGFGEYLGSRVVDIPSALMREEI